MTPSLSRKVLPFLSPFMVSVLHLHLIPTIHTSLTPCRPRLPTPVPRSSRLPISSLVVPHYFLGILQCSSHYLLNPRRGPFWEPPLSTWYCLTPRLLRHRCLRNVGYGFRVWVEPLDVHVDLTIWYTCDSCSCPLAPV